MSQQFIGVRPMRGPAPWPRHFILSRGLLLLKGIEQNEAHRRRSRADRRFRAAPLVLHVDQRRPAEVTNRSASIRPTARQYQLSAAPGPFLDVPAPHPI